MGRIRRLALVALLLSSLGALAFSATAGAAPELSKPLPLDVPDNGNPPLVAYAPDDGYTYVAWSAPGNQNNGNGVDLCVLSPTAKTCAGGGPVLLTDPNTSPQALGTNTDNTVSLGGLVILPNSGEVVVLGTPVETGTVAWASPPGGGAFLAPGGGLQDLGNFISPVSLFYTTNNAVPLSSTDVGLFDSYDHFYSYFSDSPFDGPETPATLPEETGNANNAGSFDDQKEETLGSVIATAPAPAPAVPGTEVVVGVGANVSSDEPTPPTCVNDAATGFGTVVGSTGAGGTLNSQGLQPAGFGLLACGADNPVLASGGKNGGIGVMEQEGSGVTGAGDTYDVDYRPFTVTDSGGYFATKPVVLDNITKTSLDGDDNTDLTDDSGDGVYASWEDEQGLVLDFSGTAGAGWAGPLVMPEAGDSSQGDPTIAGVGAGELDLAYEANPGTGDRVYLQHVIAIPPPTIAGKGMSTHSKVELTLTCHGACKGAYKVKVKNTAIAGGTFHFSGAGVYALKDTLTAAGKLLVKKDHGSLRVSVPLTADSVLGTFPYKFSVKLHP